MAIAIRTDGDPARLAPAVRTELRAIDPDQPIYDLLTMRDVMSDSMIALTYMATMMSTFGAIALLLAAVGIYGVIRTR